jgi:hypothetical protein
MSAEKDMDIPVEEKEDEMVTGVEESDTPG